jgi:hypothetical protein
MESRAERLRDAIENLINAKLHDALSHGNGLHRLIAHRSSGVASFPVRQAETQLQAVIASVIPQRQLAPVRSRQSAP